MSLKRTNFQRVFLLGAVLLVLMFSIFPFIQILSTSLKYQVDWGNPSLIPAQINLDAYKELLGISTEEIELPYRICIKTVILVFIFNSNSFYVISTRNCYILIGV